MDDQAQDPSLVEKKKDEGPGEAKNGVEEAEVESEAETKDKVKDFSVVSLLNPTGRFPLLAGGKAKAGEPPKDRVPLVQRFKAGDVVSFKAGGPSATVLHSCEIKISDSPPEWAVVLAQAIYPASSWLIVQNYRKNCS